MDRAVVARALSKNPEERYQTAKGLAFDLGRALVDLRERGHVEPFPLAQKDFSPKLRLPEKLLGRDSEAEQLTAAFHRVAQGAVEVLLVAGPSGIGKTALVRSVYREIAKVRGGMLLAGKHDLLGRSTPYAASSTKTGQPAVWPA